MEISSPLYNELNKAWKSTCRILLSEEIGELKEYEEWLKEYLPPTGKQKSHVSGKDVSLTTDHYCKNGRFVSLDEIREVSVEPLTINEIKDIDSIIEAVSEKWEYSGNKILGNSASVESSDLVMDSQNVAYSSNVSESSNVFLSSLVRHNSKNTFGSVWFGNGEFVVRISLALEIRRCFESYCMTHSSDLYLSHNCHGCHDLMFSFHQYNKRDCIGNLQLSKGKYTELKKKLLRDIVDELKKHKRFPSLFDMVPNEKPSDVIIPLPLKPRSEDMVPIEKAFSSTFKVLFKKEAKGIHDHEDWLSRHLPGVGEITSPFGIKTYETDFPCLASYPKKRIVSEAESFELAKLHLNENDVTSLDKIKSKLSQIGFFSTETRTGTYSNVIKSPILYGASNLYNVLQATRSENCAVDTTVLDSKYAFGCYRIHNSEFCINCHNSMYLKRCFEMDASTNCSDSYFAHNCEGLQEAMFCFNAKGKRYAIGNSPLLPEQYRRIKDMLVEQMADEILANKSLKWDIFNVGCAGR